MFHLDLTQIVVSKEKTPPRRRGAGDHILFSFGNQACQLGVRPEYELHLSVQVSGKSLATAADCSALRADVMQDAIGERKENIWEVSV
jgi:hypothetical protein